MIDMMAEIILVSVMALLAFIPLLAIFWLIVGSGRLITRMNKRRLG